MTLMKAFFIGLATGFLAASPGSAGEPPICDPGGPYGCYIGRPIEFDGRGSHDPDGSIVSYTWDFGDGHTATGAQVTHPYQSVGTYAVTLVVVDNSSISSQCQTDVRIAEPCPLPDNCPPLCDAGGPYYSFAGFPVRFDGTGSSSPYLCIPLVQYEWDFGDGATGVGPQPSHTYANLGNYTVTLTVMDADGAMSACTTIAVIGLSSAVDPTSWGFIKHRWRD